MGKVNAFEELRKTMGGTFRTTDVQKVFRQHWNEHLSAWTDLPKEVKDKVRDEINDMIPDYFWPEQEQERINYIANLEYRRNEAWHQSWKNMRKGVARSRGGGSQSIQDESPKDRLPVDSQPDGNAADQSGNDGDKVVGCADGTGQVVAMVTNEIKTAHFRLW